MDGCRDCNRTEFLRRAVAEAGRGLPGIEPGMPLPAGTGMTRRRFVSQAAGLALGIYGGVALGGRAFDDGIARAAAGGASSGRVLVSVFLSGGIDSLNVLFPAGEPAYYSLRPNLALAQGSGLPYLEDARLLWNPAAAGIATLHAEGKVSAIPAIGYADSDKSHFTSRHYWEVGATDASLRTGWLGRYVDVAGAPDNPLQGLTLDVALQPAIASAKNPVSALQAADQYTFAPPGLPPHPLESSIVEEAANIGAVHAKSADAGLRTAGSVAVQANRVYQQLTGFRSGFTSPVAYPASTDPFPHRLAGLAAMIAAGLPLGVVAITSPGRFDTHAAQAGTLQDGLQLTSDSLLAFQRDLESRGVADRVVVHVWSEFGRRAAENGSAGTDHGSAGLGFLIGTKVVGTQIGEFPGVTNGLDDQGNLVPTVDFRAVYGAIVGQWLGADPAQVIPDVSSYTLPTLIGT
jgi:uncharacterized protein (DUF1501 family)